MPSLYGTDLAVNALKAKESSNFGTRKLAFYTLICDHASGLADNWRDSDSLYFKIVQRLQGGGSVGNINGFGTGGAVELYWLGEPQVLEAPLDGSDAFTFAIADDADTPQKYLEDISTYTVLGANIDGYNNYIKLNTTNTLNRGQPIVFALTDDGVIAGKTYYIRDIEYDNDAVYVRLSETITQRNTDGTPDYPTGVGHPGDIFYLEPTPSTNPYTATVYFYDTYWTGTAGDIQFACCWDPDFKFIYAWNLYDRVDPVIDYSFTIARAQVNGGIGIFSTLGCCCISDRRLKRNITFLETRNGVKVYSFQYLWSDEYFVGVMAQDLLGTEHASAVIEHNGYYTVDYSQLGFNMQLLSDYNSLTV
jgi:hypothetical protein